MGLLAGLSREIETLVARALPCVAGVESGRSQGAGLVLAQDGYILTNAHVVRARGPIQVGLPGGGRTPAELVGADARTDLAVLRAEASGLSALPLGDSREVRVGQIVVAVGNPHRFERSVSLGVVSALDRTLPAPDGHLAEGLIQTDAAVNPGNSGGPLLDAEGSVVGITTAAIRYAQGIAFAIPSRTADWIAAVLIREGAVARPFVGIAARGEELDPEARREAGQARAVRVLKVGAATPAERSGLRDGDLILAASGASVPSVDDLQRVLVLGGARGVSLDVLRGGRRRRIDVEPRPADAAA
jgi:S1-C subfamily serine protease